MAPARPATPADAVLGVTPRTVLEPATVAEAVEAVKASARDRLRLAFVGGGTDLELGGSPQALDAVLRTGGMARVVEYAPSDQIVVAEAGLTVAALQRALAPHRQRLALDPPLPDRATVGGVVAASAFGPLRARYGSVRDLVIGISVIRADGTLAKGGGKVVKNVAGFDLPRLMVGSLGTLGLVATATFRVHPLPEAEATLLFGGVDPAAVRGLFRDARAAQLEPAAAAALWAAGRLDLGVRFEGFAPGVAQQGDRLLEVGRRAGLSGDRLDAEGAAGFWRRHDAVRTGGTLRVKLAAPASALGVVVEQALAPLLAALEGGGAAVYPTLGLAFASGVPASPEVVAAAAGRARGALSALGGSLVLAAAPREVRTAVDPWGPPPSAFPVMQALKERLDPERRLNPGRFVGGI